MWVDIMAEAIVRLGDSKFSTVRGEHERWLSVRDGVRRLTE